MIGMMFQADKRTFLKSLLLFHPRELKYGRNTNSSILVQKHFLVVDFLVSILLSASTWPSLIHLTFPDSGLLLGWHRLVVQPLYSGEMAVRSHVQHIESRRKTYMRMWR